MQYIIFLRFITRRERCGFFYVSAGQTFPTWKNTLSLVLLTQMHCSSLSLHGSFLPICSLDSWIAYMLLYRSNIFLHYCVQYYKSQCFERAAFISLQFPLKVDINRTLSSTFDVFFLGIRSSSLFKWLACSYLLVMIFLR